MNCVCPIAPAQLPVIPDGAHVAVLQDLQRRDQLALEEAPPPPLVGERRQRRDHRHVAAPLAVEALHPPDRGHHLGLDPVARLDRAERPPLLRQRRPPLADPLLRGGDRQIVLERPGELGLVAVPLDHPGQEACLREGRVERRRARPPAPAPARGTPRPRRRTRRSAPAASPGRAPTVHRTLGPGPPPHPARSARSPKPTTRRVACILCPAARLTQSLASRRRRQPRRVAVAARRGAARRAATPSPFPALRLNPRATTPGTAMKFTLAWLKEHLETDADLAAITFALTDLGLEVEGVTNPADRLAAFTVGEVLEACPAPRRRQAPRLPRRHRATARSRSSAAPRTRRTGIKVVVAAPGDWIPGIDTTIKVGRIRGVESHGMMLSEREMELSDEHSGIVELAPDAPVGARYIDVAPFDPVIEIAVTPNRPDALGVAGIARDLAARGLGRLVTPEVEPVPGAFPEPGRHLPRPRRRRRGLPALRRPPDPRRPERPLAAVAAGPPARHRPAPDLRARRHHQLRHLRPQPPAARLRRGQGPRPDHRPPRPPRREADRARRQGLRLRRLRDPGLRRQRPGGDRRRHGRPAHRRHRGNHRRPRRGGLVRPDPHRPHRPPPADQLRRPLPLRARRRPGLHPRGH